MIAYILDDYGSAWSRLYLDANLTISWVYTTSQLSALLEGEPKRETTHPVIRDDGNTSKLVGHFAVRVGSIDTKSAIPSCDLSKIGG